jgi:SAM-dependent methyltransferase
MRQGVIGQVCPDPAPSMPGCPALARSGPAANVSGVPTRAELSQSFGSIAADYDRLRSQPADEAVDWLVPGRRDLLVDLGAGTGIFSRALASRAAHVIAVEPDDRMRAVLQARSPGVEVLAGSGEAIPLPDASADGVFASSAWHWMDSSRAIPEVARVLRDGGRLGVIWTGRDRESEWLRADEWFREAAREGDPFNADRERRENQRRREISLPGSGGLFRNIETRTFSFTRAMTPAELVEMLATYSRIITASPQDRERGRNRATAALAELFPGADHIDVPMRSRCWRGDRVPRKPE